MTLGFVPHIHSSGRKWSDNLHAMSGKLVEPWVVLSANGVPILCEGPMNPHQHGSGQHVL